MFLINFLLTFFLLYIYLTKINFQNIFDENQSGYGSKKKTKTASGIVFSLILLLNLIYYFLPEKNIDTTPNRFYVFLSSIFLLSLMSFLDDLKSLDPKFRLISQTIIVYFSLTLINLEYYELPLKLIIFIYLIFWIYTINITNFIDGSDGYLSVNAISFFLGLLIINKFLPDIFFSKHLAIIMLPILFSFIYFNKPKAKLYMGDTGSILIGYVAGFCLLEIISSDYWPLAIALYSYPFIDCSLTLVKKIFLGRNIFKRDFDYFFLKPIKKKQTNNYFVLSVTIIYNILNLFIIYSVLYYEIIYLVIISIILSLIKIKIFESK
jgi:UDP-N-acetylmuramyl pentapeptide phosphotransferase/UDP-N-acetylglucosamine-1-phosphate transferase